MGGEFVYYSAMSVALGGEELRAKKIMREAILEWERELSCGCKYYRKVTQLFECFVGDYSDMRHSELLGMLGYGKLFLGDIKGAGELFTHSVEILPSYKISFELELLKKDNIK